MSQEDCQCACCCASITIFDNPRLGGLHPDATNRIAQTLTGDSTGKRWQFIVPSVHVLGGTFFAPKSNRGDEIFVHLYSASQPTLGGNIDARYTFSLVPGGSHALGDELAGVRFDYGVFVEVIGEDPTTAYLADRLMINLTYIERRYYSPAFYDQDALLNHYWHCVRGETALWSGFDLGSENEVWDDSGEDPPSWGGVIDPDPGEDDDSGSWLLDETGNPITNQNHQLIDTHV